MVRPTFFNSAAEMVIRTFILDGKYWSSDLKVVVHLEVKPVEVTNFMDLKSQ